MQSLFLRGPSSSTEGTILPSYSFQNTQIFLLVCPALGGYLLSPYKFSLPFYVYLDAPRLFSLFPLIQSSLLSTCVVSVSRLQSNWYAFFFWLDPDKCWVFFPVLFFRFPLACAFQDHLLNLVLDLSQYFLRIFSIFFKYCLLFSLSHSSLHCDLQIYVIFYTFILLSLLYH